MVMIVHKTHDDKHKLFENITENESVEIVLQNGFIVPADPTDKIILNGEIVQVIQINKNFKFSFNFNELSVVQIFGGG